MEDKKPRWIVNFVKYQRALALSKTKDEEDTKKIYIELGGLVDKSYIETKDEVVTPKEETIPNEAISTEEVIVTTEPKVKKVAKNAK